MRGEQGEGVVRVEVLELQQAPGEAGRVRARVRVRARDRVRVRVRVNFI